jgi:hypothetical protein
MLKVKLNVIASNVRCHRDDRRPVELTNEMTRRDSIQIGHNYVHQD